jgi:hypothetical protein
VAYVLGAGWLGRGTAKSPLAGVRELGRCPAWMQQNAARTLATIHHPEVARMMVHLAKGRAARTLAVAWLRENTAFAEPVLTRMETRPAGDEAKLVAAARALCAAETPSAAAKPLSATSARKEREALCATLLARLLACGGDAEAECAVMEAAFASYCQINTASGDITPEASFTHPLDCFGALAEGDRPRFIDLGVAVALSTE